MISLSTHFHCSVAIPRALVDSSAIPTTALANSIPQNIPYTSDQFTFVHGDVKTFDYKSKTVHYIPLTDDYKEAESATISYDSLFVCLGSHTKHPAFKIRHSHTEVAEEIEKLSKQIAAASSIVIAGGGPVAVETAGEIASKYGQSKAITILTNGSKLFHNTNPDIGTSANAILKSLGVHVTVNAQVSGATPLEDGKTRVNFGKDDSIDADLYIDATGVLPNNTSIPKELLNERGFLAVNGFQRVEQAGPLVYGLGDIVGGWTQIAELLYTKPIVTGNWAYELSGGKVGKEKEYTTPKYNLLVVPIGTKKSVMTAFGWRFPSWVGWFLKGRTYMIEKAIVHVTAGGI